MANELQRTAHKLTTEIHHLDRIMSHDPVNAELALSVAKRVRRDSTLLVRLLAALRDNELQPKEGTST